jgi:hypothetical protein
MKYVITAIFMILFLGPSFCFAEPEGGQQDAAFETRVGGFRGHRGRGSGFGRRGYRKGYRFQQRDLTRYFYYVYPRYYYRNYGAIRKFYPSEDRSFYPHQGGSDYRDWFYFPRR